MAQFTCEFVRNCSEVTLMNNMNINDNNKKRIK